VPEQGRDGHAAPHGVGLRVFDVTHATAHGVSLTSLAHSPATCVLRRLELGEPLDERDSRPTARVHVPIPIGASPGLADEVTAAEINPGAVTTPIRQAQSSQSFAYTLAANAKATSTTNLTSTQVTLCGLNISGSPISGVATVYFW